jgi:hypothetical protein
MLTSHLYTQCMRKLALFLLLVAVCYQNCWQRHAAQKQLLHSQAWQYIAGMLHQLIQLSQCAPLALLVSKVRLAKQRQAGGQQNMKRALVSRLQVLQPPALCFG